MATIDSSVGDWSKGAENDWEDVETVQELLKLAAKKTGNDDYDPWFADGIILPWNSRTLACIKAFQSRFMSTPDGIISPGRKTIRTLSEFESGGGGTAPVPAPSNAKVDGEGCCYPLARIPWAKYTVPGPGEGKHKRYFGARRYSKKQGGYRKHAACDLLVPEGTPIFAVDDGVVHHIGHDFLSGTRKNGEEWAVGYVTVIHKNFTVRYAETRNNFPVKKGQEVKKGQKIAEVGMMNTSKMLHFEMYSSNKAGGSLTQRSGQRVTKEFGLDTPFQRRNDLIDPTPYLEKWKLNLPKP